MAATDTHFRITKAICMINRILIRIKVIQILYSFLLVENEFSLPEQPESPTKEKRFAYSLYLDWLYLLTRIAEGVTTKGRAKPLADTRLIKRLLVDDKVKSLVLKYGGEPFPLSRVTGSLTDAVSESAIYKNWLKKSDDTDPSNIRVWRDIFNIIVVNDPEMKALVAGRSNYTLRGEERAKAMMEETFVSFMASQDNVGEAQRTLRKSLDQAYELYYRMLALPVELTNLRERQLDERRHKYIVTDEDLNPNLRMIENQLVESLRGNEKISSFIEKHSWLTEDPVMMNNLLKAIVSSDVYRDYENLPATDYHADAEFWRNVFKRVIFYNPDFLESLEDKSVFWNDDVEIVGTFLLKTFKKMDESNGADCVMDQYKDGEDGEDANFGKELLTYVWRNKDSYRDMINDVVNTGSWDTDRLAFMDVVILETALAEIINFPKIPLNASINEYIEIAKSYSTAKSGFFVNGIIGSIVRKLREEDALIGK